MTTAAHRPDPGTSSGTRARVQNNHGRQLFVASGWAMARAGMRSAALWWFADGCTTIMKRHSIDFATLLALSSHDVKTTPCVATARVSTAA